MRRAVKKLIPAFVFLLCLTGGAVERKAMAQASTMATAEAGKWRIDYNLTNGMADIWCGGKILIPQAYAEVKLPETVTSRDYKTRKVTRRKVADGFGRGMEFTVESANGTPDKMIQTFWLYETLDYMLADVKISRKPGASSNFMSPLTTETPVNFPAEGGNRALAVPFDNDKWVRYNAAPFGTNLMSYEVAAFYNNASRQGLVIGSVEHGVWKTGVKSVTAADAVTRLQIFGGATSEGTHDVLPHGKIGGTTIKSPKIFIGSFADWRDGLETYAKANAVVAPPRPWKGGVPFGWNSWGKLQKKISFQKAVEVSDFFAKELPEFKNDGVVYIGLDSGWNKFSDAELKEFVAHCHANHQEAGIYFTPFSVWKGGDDTPVAGTGYQYRDIYLYANNQKQVLDGGTALDPTHPGTKKLIEATIARFKQAGFKYVKADFLTHGALEGDKFFDSKVTTGMQAYNAGMKYVDETLGGNIYLNESISPLFPSQYANSRRIACDSYGWITETEYMLNSLTYGWWLAGVYDFNDADHVVLDGRSEGENRARVTSSVITGIFTSGDDFSAGGSADGKKRAGMFLTNAEVTGLARIKKSFRPVEGDTGDHAANLFTFEDGKFLYLAAINYGNAPIDVTVNFHRLGFDVAKPVLAKELWSGRGVEWPGTETNNAQVGAKDACLYKIAR